MWLDCIPAKMLHVAPPEETLAGSTAVLWRYFSSFPLKVETLALQRPTMNCSQFLLLIDFQTFVMEELLLLFTGRPRDS